MYRYALFYKPACGEWYIHSHKLYLTEEAAEKAARKFLMSGQEYAIKLIALYALQGRRQII